MNRYAALNPWRGLAGLPVAAWLLCASALINRAGSMALAFLTLYLTREQGWSVSQAGIALALYGAGAFITGPLAGQLCDRVGAVRVIRWSLLLSGCLLMLFPFAGSRPAVYTLCFLWSLTGEAVRPASLAALGELVGPEQRRAAFALNRLAVNLGMSIGPATGGFLATVSFPALFVVDGATSLLAAVAIILFAKPSVARRPASAPPWQALTVLGDRRLMGFLLGIIPAVMVFFQLTAVMPLFLVKELGLSVSTYGLMFTINTGLILMLEVAVNTSMAHWPHRRALPLGAILLGVGFGSLAFTTSAAGVAMAVVIWTFGEMILLPTSAAFVADIAPEGRTGEYMGLYTMAFSVAFSLGPAAGTFVFDRFGSTAVWMSCLGCGLLSAAVLRGVCSRAPGVDPPGRGA